RATATLKVPIQRAPKPNQPARWISPCPRRPHQERAGRESTTGFICAAVLVRAGCGRESPIAVTPVLVSISAEEPSRSTSMPWLEHRLPTALPLEVAFRGLVAPVGLRATELTPC